MCSGAVGRRRRPRAPPSEMSCSQGGQHLGQGLTGEVRLEDGQMEIPGGLTLGEEWEAIRRIQGREVKPALVEWLMGLAEWRTKVHLTFDSLAHPERAERAVRRWRKDVCPRATILVGYERQERGAVHMHLAVDCLFDYSWARAVWNERAGWCRMEEMSSPEGALGYVLKHVVKDMDFEILSGALDGRIAPAVDEEVVERWGTSGKR